jgi:hypothetical protein
MIVDKIWKWTNVHGVSFYEYFDYLLFSLNFFFEKLVQYHGHDSQSKTQWVLNKSNKSELLLHLQHLIPCPSLPTINHVHKRPLLITVLLISTGFDDVKITTVYKHPGV